MKESYLSVLFCLTTLLCVAAPPTADEVLRGAQTKAAAENKTVFVHFTASWCVWCRRLDSLLERPEIKSVFQKHFVPVHLVIQETGKNKALENAGADKVFKRLGGSESAGLPFFAFLDSHGKLLINSMRPSRGGRSENIAFPGEPERADWFVAMVKKAAPLISEDDLKTVETALGTTKAK